MKKRGGTKWKELLAEFFELPREVVLDLPRLILVGNSELFLENHRGIIEYDESKVRVGTRNGEIIIRGQGLQIRSMLQQELSLVGFIEAVEFEE